MMTTQQEVEVGWRRISELENESENRLQEIKDREEELSDQQLKIDALEEEVEKLKDLLVAYKAEAAALRQDNEELEAKVERLK
jgi:chromosome segregation ATPase